MPPRYPNKNRQEGGNFDELLREEGSIEEVEAVARKRAAAMQLAAPTQANKVKKTAPPGSGSKVGAKTKSGLPFSVPTPPIDRMARLRRMFPDGPVKSGAQDVVDYDRGG